MNCRRMLLFQSLEARQLLAADAPFSTEGLSAEGEYWDAGWYNDCSERESCGEEDTVQIEASVDAYEPSVVAVDQLLRDYNASGEEGDVQLFEALDILEVDRASAHLEDGLVWITELHSDTSAWVKLLVGDTGGYEREVELLLPVREHIHGPHTAKMMEHMEMLRIVPRLESTAVAVEDGDWSAGDTWRNGRIPREGDRVLIPEHVSVKYDLVTSPELEWLRVDGDLQWDTSHDTQLTVETLVSTYTSTVEIGTAENPVPADRTAEILVDTSSGPLSQEDDPTLVSRGVLLHGTTRIHGTEKTHKVAMSVDPLAGDTTLTLRESPTGWRVGDTLLIPGTFTDRTLDVSEYDAADAINARFHDELRTIQAITGTSVTLDEPLQWDHVRPEGDTFDPEELSLYVANMTRNVVVRSSDPDVDIQERGHVMLMHNPDVVVEFAQFKDLGRSNKRLTVDDPQENFDGSPGYGTNPRGRYPLHIHRTGAGSYETPAVALTGNVVWDGPGWGIVHHDSHAMIRDNVVFDIAGAGIVAEDGNEIGEWSGNLVVKATGDLVNNFDDNAIFANNRGPRFDLGFVGSGYWVQGGGFGILMTDNVAASINAAGFDLVHETDGLANEERFGPELIADPDIRRQFVEAGVTEVAPANIPMRGFTGAEVYNAFRGIHTWLHNRDSTNMEGGWLVGTRYPHDFDSVIEDFTLWSVQTGVQNFYSTRMDYLDGLIVGDVENPIRQKGDTQANNTRGMGVTHNRADANRIDFDGLRVEGFEYGFQTFQPERSDGRLTRHGQSSLKNAKFANVDVVFAPDGSRGDLWDDYSELFELENVLSDIVTQPATPSFTHESVGGTAVRFDASDSVGEDSRWGGGIAAYAWDFDADGQFDDAVGATVQHSFPGAGTYSVGLQVWDNQANMSRMNSSIEVVNQPVGNILLDPNFESAGGSNQYKLHSERRDKGWQTVYFEYEDGIATATNNRWGFGSAGQVVEDNYLINGNIQLAFDAFNFRENNPERGDVQVSVWGVDNQYSLSSRYGEDVKRAGLLTPPRKELLIHESIPVYTEGRWESLSFSADVGEGFEQYVVSFAYTNRYVGSNNQFALRNVYLQPEASNE